MSAKDAQGFTLARSAVEMEYVISTGYRLEVLITNDPSLKKLLLIILQKMQERSES